MDLGADAVGDHTHDALAVLKLAIVMEAEQPGVSAAAVCRRHNSATSMIFR
jgi:hypothetical protein